MKLRTKTKNWVQTSKPTAFANDVDGASGVEHAVILGFVGVAAVGWMNYMSVAEQNSANTVSASINTTYTAAQPPSAAVLPASVPPFVNPLPPGPLPPVPPTSPTTKTVYVSPPSPPPPPRTCDNAKSFHSKIPYNGVNGVGPHVPVWCTVTSVTMSGDVSFHSTGCMGFCVVADWGDPCDRRDGSGTYTISGEGGSSSASFSVTVWHRTPSCMEPP